MMKKLLCFIGIHSWDLKFWEGALSTYEECDNCKKRRAGWLK